MEPNGKFFGTLGNLKSGFVNWGKSNEIQTQSQK